MRFDQVIGLLSLARPAMGGALARRAVAPMVMLVGLAIVAGMLAIIMLCIGLLALHHGFLEHGLSPAESLTYTALCVLALLLITVLAMVRIVQQARNALKPRAASDLVQAFLDGFNKPPRR